ncbi:hypothetical protein DF107_32185 [Burkholderia stagnalis]|uniref:Uncharacterized protein n=1 Tax=Burkholderia stagnalis TaxID=1503054 RepID=A0ABX9YED3_9BURK|nr:hypothetical protein DF161_31310 [Burkholderia stagnalis]RQQ12561.1 hypothetical protein DF164_07280 [Burkholderia stagnalis]RQQ25425.1 hypothetical protein DF149_26985 [Burkholderia stagnalis]RQQ31183.1 hypothetical protein DF148_21595 [Burkholderia stagnalis]RQQ33882.1 hypothetical protein DF163_07330 [Burkholderia stagnalis]
MSIVKASAAGESGGESSTGHSPVLTSCPAGRCAPAAALLPRRRMRPVPPFLCAGCTQRARTWEAMFDGGMWGLVRLPGTGCARRES